MTLIRFCSSLWLVLGAWPVAGIDPQDLVNWLTSSDGLGLPKSAASTLANQESRTLTQCGVKVSDLQGLKDVMSSPSKLDLGMQAVQSNIFFLAEEHISPQKLGDMYYYLSASYTIGGGLALPKAEAQKKALSMTLAKAEPDQLRDLYKVMYGYSGLGFEKQRAQTEAIQEALAGTDAATFKETYQKKLDLKDAIFMGVSGNLQGLVKRYAKDGKAYTAEEFQKYYSEGWLTEWLAAPLEKKVSTDKKAYTASAFSRHFGSNWAAKYRTSEEATQIRLAKNSQAYSIPQFQSYYKDDWQSQWMDAPELRCAECSPYMGLEARLASELVV